MIVCIEGSNCRGKTTLINELTKKYGYSSSKSVPDWFQQYIPFARNLEPKFQRKVYEVGHIAAYMDAQKQARTVLFDRSYISTFIRLFFEENKSIEKCVEDVMNFKYKPDLVVVLVVPFEIVYERYKTIHNGESPNFKFYVYENEVFKHLARKCDNIIIVNNDISMEDNFDKNSNIIHKIVKRKEFINESIK